jgi:thiamine biosynthesis lipoprotein
VRALLVASVVCAACSRATFVERSLAGATMGTSWSATCVVPEAVGEDELRAALVAELAAVNARASTWDPKSELARFDAARTTEPFECSRELAALVGHALSLAQLTGGAFDPTVLPLVRAYGFAAEGSREFDDRALAAAREHVGFEKVVVEERALRKLDPDVELDLSGIAPGDAVDRLGALLDAHGASAWLVELGGEVRARGAKLDGTPWIVGVEVPSEIGRAHV